MMDPIKVNLAHSKCKEEQLFWAILILYLNLNGLIAENRMNKYIEISRA